MGLLSSSGLDRDVIQAQAAGGTHRDDHTAAASMLRGGVAVELLQVAEGQAERRSYERRSYERRTGFAEIQRGLCRPTRQTRWLKGGHMESEAEA